MPRSARVVTVVGGAVVLALAATLAGASWWVHHTSQGPLEAHAAQAAQNLELFCELKAKLDADPFFQRPHQHGDASPLLNAWLSWDAVGHETLPAGSPLVLPPGLPFDVVGRPLSAERQPEVADGRDGGPLTGRPWLADTLDVSTLDFTWMARLHQFDRWDLAGEKSPLTALELRSWDRAPMPSFITLQAWAKLRLRDGIQRGDPLPAVADVRQLAYLAYRTDTLLGGMVATALLKSERLAYQSMPSPPEQWEPMSELQLDRFKRVLWVSPDFSSVMVAPDVASRSRDCGQFAGCTALTEAAGNARFLADFAGSRFSQGYAALDRAVKATPCSTTLTAKIWAAPAGAPTLTAPLGDPGRAWAVFLSRPTINTLALGNWLRARAAHGVPLRPSDGGTP